MGNRSTPHHHADKIRWNFLFLMNTVLILCDVISKCHTFKYLLNTEWGKKRFEKDSTNAFVVPRRVERRKQKET